MTVLDSSGMRSSALLFTKIYEYLEALCIYIYIQFFGGRNSMTEGMMRREIGGKRAFEIWVGFGGDLAICVPQSKLSVSGRIGIPMSQGCHPSFQPGPLSYKVGE